MTAIDTVHERDMKKPQQAKIHTVNAFCFVVTKHIEAILYTYKCFVGNV